MRQIQDIAQAGSKTATLVDLSPEAVFEDLLGLLEALVVLEAVQVS